MFLESGDVREHTKAKNEEEIAAVSKESLMELGYFLCPRELFSAVFTKGNANLNEGSNFILHELKRIQNDIKLTRTIGLLNGGIHRYNFLSDGAIQKTLHKPHTMNPWQFVFWSTYTEPAYDCRTIFE